MMMVTTPRARCFRAQVAATRHHCLEEEMDTQSSQLLKHNQEWPCAGVGMEAAPLPLVLSWTKKREPGTEADWAPSHKYDTFTQL